MKNIANYLSISRAIMSIILAISETFSFPFYNIYIYCGISDMLDGYVARRTKSTSKIGARLDSIADIIFVIVAIVKILPVLHLSDGIVIWAVIIALIKMINVIYSYIYYKKLVLPHTIANKITGLILFIAPLIIINTNPIIFEIIICSIATFAAVQEGHYIRTGKEENPINEWNKQTNILYGNKDNMQEQTIIQDFSNKFNCELSILENGEHYFHTEEQLNYYKNWLDKVL